VTLYLDTSAIVKRYVSEPGSNDLIALTVAAEVTATSLVTRAEVAAALARAVRIGALDNDSGRRAQRQFSQEWPNIVKIPITEALVFRAETLAWNHGLRGYDAVQLAAALTWQDSIGQDVVVATFDRQLWETSHRSGLRPWPETLTTGQV
jgi:predicted nucleic acid-binding protein